MSLIGQVGRHIPTWELPPRAELLHVRRATCRLRVLSRASRMCAVPVCLVVKHPASAAGPAGAPADSPQVSELQKTLESPARWGVAPLEDPLLVDESYLIL